MLTIFTIPKQFTDTHINIIQRNAIKSWTLLRPACEIILIGNDEGVAEVAKEFNVKHIPGVKINEFNTPLLNSAFKLAGEKSANEILMYLNADIILTGDLQNIINKLPKEKFLAVGKRWDINIDKEINFDKNKNLYDDEKIHSPSGMDYFIFKKGSFKNMPDLAVGRVGWDNWMIFNARKNNIKTIDLSDVLKVYHQNHGYSGTNNAERKTNPEAQKNISYLKYPLQVYNIEDTKYKLTKNGVKKKYFYWISTIKRYYRHLIYKIKSS